MEGPKSSYPHEVNECQAVFAFYEEPWALVLEKHQNEWDPDTQSKTKSNPKSGSGLVLEKENSAVASNSGFADQTRLWFWETLV